LKREADIQVVAEAADGRAALEMVAAHAPDVILLDVRLPIMDGFETTRAIAASHPATRVIVLSMFDDEETKAKAIAAGACGCYSKAGDLKVTLAAIRAGGCAA
jgi:DNA-binding NarL/FixJ family response regulator